MKFNTYAAKQFQLVHTSFTQLWQHVGLGPMHRPWVTFWHPGV